MWVKYINCVLFFAAHLSSLVSLCVLFVFIWRAAIHIEFWVIWVLDLALNRNNWPIPYRPPVAHQQKNSKQIIRHNTSKQASERHVNERENAREKGRAFGENSVPRSAMCVSVWGDNHLDVLVKSEEHVLGFEITWTWTGRRRREGERARKEDERSDVSQSFSHFLFSFLIFLLWAYDVRFLSHDNAEWRSQSARTVYPPLARWVCLLIKSEKNRTK